MAAWLCADVMGSPVDFLPREADMIVEFKIKGVWGGGLEFLLMNLGESLEWQPSLSSSDFVSLCLDPLCHLICAVLVKKL